MHCADTTTLVAAATEIEPTTTTDPLSKCQSYLFPKEQFYPIDYAQKDRKDRDGERERNGCVHTITDLLYTAVNWFLVASITALCIPTVVEIQNYR